MNHYHFIDWNSGFTPVHQFVKIIKILTKDVDMVYIKGNEKFNFMKKYSEVPVYKFDESPPLPLTKPTCFHHNSKKCVCALSNVFFLYHNFLMNQ